MLNTGFPCVYFLGAASYLVSRIISYLVSRILVSRISYHVSRISYLVSRIMIPIKQKPPQAFSLAGLSS
ncbi:hypothetical protein OH492_04900 [Vibrio chagasii]|nr:hypothetical protein [Vibrio chagasii]